VCDLGWGSSKKVSGNVALLNKEQRMASRRVEHPTGHWGCVQSVFGRFMNGGESGVPDFALGPTQWGIAVCLD